MGYGTNKSTGRLAHIKSEDTYEVGMQLEKRALPSVFLSYNLDLPWRERAMPWTSTTAMDHKDQKFPCRQDNVGIGMNSSSFSLVQSWRFSLWNESDAMIAQPARTFRNQAKVGTGALIFSLSSLLSFARIFWCSFPRGKESHATTDTTHGHATSQPADLVVVLWMWESGIFDALSLDLPPTLPVWH